MKRLWIVLTALMIVSIVLSAFAAAEEFSVGAETISTGETAAAELIDEIPGEAPDVVLGGEDGEGAASLVTLRAAASGEVEPTCQEYSVGGNKFLYSDEMLLGDAREFSSDLAKISVALAEAAYRKDGIKDLEKLGYAVDQTSYDASYSRVTKKPNDGGMTLYDNDYVAYSIWRKDYGDYTFYIIPVKGTSANLEWFSDFNLGNTSENNGYHEGFYKAARRALTDIYNCFAQNGSSDGTRVVLFTGHSRGAAVANLLAGWMTDEQTYVSQNHLFCYTFACPSVGHANVVSNYSNIRNFNNAGDLIPLLPLETGVTAGWNFSRYGRTFDQNLTGLENFNRLFTNKWGDAYLGQASETNYNNLIKSIIPEESSYEEKHWALDLLSYYVFGGKDYTTWDEFLHYMVTRHGIDIVKFIGKQTTIGKLADFAQRLENRRQEWEEQIELIQALQDALADPGDKTEEEIFKEHRTAVEIVKNLYEITTNPTMSQINQSIYLLQEMIDESIRTFEGGWGLVSLFCDSSFMLQDAIYDAHEPHTYLFWINSKYAGCDSWSGTDITIVPGECALGDCTSIGARAFSGCTSLRGIPIPEELRYIGDSAFSGCSGATGEIAFPNSLRYIGASAFSGCSGITGKLEFSNALQYVGSSAFYNCSGITGAVTFSDGLEFLGENAFNGCAGIETLVVPDTVKTVGNSSFANCPGLKSLTIPVEMLYTYGAFYVNGTTMTTSVETLHLTAGTTGKMHDMTGESYGSGYINGVTYQSREHLQTVALGEGITHVGNYAFYGCSVITSMSLPSTLESVGHYAFQNVSQWAGPLALPEGLTTLGVYSFAGCSGLTGLSLPSTLVAIPDSCFRGCIKIPKVEVPEAATSIGESAFENCTGMEELVIPDTVTSLGYYSIAGCSGLKELTMPAEHVRPGVFYYSSGSSGTTSVETLHLTAGTTGKMYDMTSENYGNGYINGVTYQSHAHLQTVILGEGITHVGNYAFYGCSKITSMSLPSTLESVGHYAFQNVSQWAGPLELPEGLTTLGVDSFAGCSGLTGLSLPSTLTGIPSYCFQGCSGIPKIEVPEAATSIGTYAFQNCTGLEELVIPDTVTSIGEYSIGSCSGLKELTMPAEHVRPDVFYYGSGSSTNSVETLHLTPGATGKMHDMENSDSDSNRYKWGVAYMSREHLATVILEEGITRIGNCAFYGCSKITSVSLPSTLESVGHYAFQNVSQWAGPLALPEGLTTLGVYSFAGCSGLTAPVRLPDTLTSIGSNAFRSVTGTLEVYPYSEGLRYARSANANHVVLEYAELALPAALIEIDDEAFANTPAELIALPEGCESIGSRAFAGSAARALILPDDVDIAADAFAGCPVQVVVCGADTPTQAWAQAMGFRTWTTD